MSVEKIINAVIEREGGYVNHPHDKGGPTCWGITQNTAQHYGYTGYMYDMTKEQAYDIYLQRYWIEPGFDKVAELSERVAEELFDTGVNAGFDRATQMFQRALNLLNRMGQDFPDIEIDGDIGPATMEAFAALLSKRGVDGEEVMMKTLNILQGFHYVIITEARQVNESFFYGWIKNRVGL